ncbi:putative quinol monooxygenase [Donghicola tyrosinivorans]|uniref:Quinol monooxygenase YgiN n=1 Tax=Donghicola tyrosinivorans TaxID=1652492 RepID=A0A2T0WKP9_9RHOB|nr:antibiotic biosynthesis monooxygenase [Donghicola tyrosinivorans]PRY87288.1 quinol monooxygenase YgiN [Donghicola tyrosinivorans]
MITEIATLKIDPDLAQRFEETVLAARPHFLAAPDCLSFRLDRVVEEAGTYLLIVGWTSVAAHMEDFRQTEGFQRWRELAGPFFTAPPQVIHSAKVI